jgi:hypothetical protein
MVDLPPIRGYIKAVTCWGISGVLYEGKINSRGSA